MGLSHRELTRQQTCDTAQHKSESSILSQCMKVRPGNSVRLFEIPNAVCSSVHTVQTVPFFCVNKLHPEE